MLTCANKDCDIQFIAKTHNQKYHSDECCRLATNRRIMENYYHTRDRKKGKTRFCHSCGKTKLSRYNDSLICSACKKEREMNANRAALDMLMTASITP